VKNCLQASYVNASDSCVAGLALDCREDETGKYGQQLFTKLATSIVVVYKHCSRIPKT
jgi:hypothetical protein